MTLLPIKEDFIARTLAHVPGILGKLGYVAELRRNGKYEHWGLTRIYGEQAAQRALTELHGGLFLQVLRTPLQRLSEDLVRSAAAQDLDVRSYLNEILRNESSLIPRNLGGGSEAHFRSVITALSALYR